jgi:hypothetical protein
MIEKKVQFLVIYIYDNVQELPTADILVKKTHQALSLGEYACVTVISNYDVPCCLSLESFPCCVELRVFLCRFVASSQTIELHADTTSVHTLIFVKMLCIHIFCCLTTRRLHRHSCCCCCLYPAQVKWALFLICTSRCTTSHSGSAPGWILFPLDRGKSPAYHLSDRNGTPETHQGRLSKW